MPEQDLNRWRGQMEARMAHNEAMLAEIRANVASIKSGMDEVRGGRKALWTLLAGAGLIISMISAAATYITFR